MNKNKNKNKKNNNNVCASKVNCLRMSSWIWMTLSSSYMIMTIHLEFY